MTGIEAPAIDKKAAYRGIYEGGAPTVGWFVRRSMLWLVILTSTVAAACLLYGVASNAESTVNAPSTTVSANSLGI